MSLSSQPVRAECSTLSWCILMLKPKGSVRLHLPGGRHRGLQNKKAGFCCGGGAFTRCCASGLSCISFPFQKPSVFLCFPQLGCVPVCLLPPGFPWGASTSYPFLPPTTCKVDIVGKVCFSDPFSINKHSPVSHCSHKPCGRLMTGHSRRWYRNERRPFLSWHGPYQRSFHCRQNKIGGHSCTSAG